jgi:ribosome-associated protein
LEKLQEYSPIPARKSTKPVQRLLNAVLKSLDDDKAQDAVSIGLAGKSSIADYMVIASGTSHRHVASMADHVVRRLKDQGYETRAAEGLPQADWVLIDAGDVVVHLFRPEVRAFYNLEKMWSADIDRGLVAAV